MAFQRQNTQTKQIIYGSLYSHYRTIDLNLTLFESKFALGLVLLQVCTWPIWDAECIDYMLSGDK